jgi:uncharacterized protein
MPPFTNIPDPLAEQNLLCSNDSEQAEPFWSLLKYALVGIFFGIVFVKAEIISWFRIQEMFHLHSFFMYGVIGTAVLVAALSVFLIKHFNIRTFQGEVIKFEDKTFNKGQVYGGVIFGIGWAITGACPGPLFAQIGSGFAVVSITLLSAIFGTWVYGKLRPFLPH